MRGVFGPTAASVAWGMWGGGNQDSQSPNRLTAIRVPGCSCSSRRSISALSRIPSAAASGTCLLSGLGFEA